MMPLSMVEMSPSMAKELYITKKDNLNHILAMTQTLLRDQNASSDKLDEARGELKVFMDAFRATRDGLSKSQVRKTQYERNHLWRCVTDCLEDLNVAIRLKRQQERQAEAERVRQEKAAEEKAAEEKVAEEKAAREAAAKKAKELESVEIAVENKKDLPQSSGKLSEDEFYNMDIKSVEAAAKNEKDLSQYSE